MTANELLKVQLDDVTFQMEKVLEGISENDLDFKPAPTPMSVREQLEHLCEVYVAVEEEFRGVKHAWGEFTLEDKSLENLTAEIAKHRAVAITAVSGADTSDDLSKAYAFMVAHENYHIGQLVALRLAINPDWNAYSIYRHG